MYTSRGGSGMPPPTIPPRESSIPVKNLKTTAPEVKKKKVKRAESSKVREPPGKELSLLIGGSGKRTEILGSKER